MKGKERADIRARANTLKPALIIGKNEINENVINQITEYFESHEIIKISVLNSVTTELKDIADELTSKIKADVIQIIGKKIVLYSTFYLKD